MDALIITYEFDNSNNNINNEANNNNVNNNNINNNDVNNNNINNKNDIKTFIYEDEYNLYE